jgi:hypothetical protein
MNNNIDNTVRKIFDEQKHIEVPQIITNIIDNTLSTLDSKKNTDKKFNIVLPNWIKHSISIAVCLILLIGSLYFIIPLMRVISQK